MRKFPSYRQEPLRRETWGNEWRPQIDTSQSARRGQLCQRTVCWRTLGERPPGSPKCGSSSQCSKSLVLGSQGIAPAAGRYSPYRTGLPHASRRLRVLGRVICRPLAPAASYSNSCKNFCCQRNYQRRRLLRGFQVDTSAADSGLRAPAVIHVPGPNLYGFRRGPGAGISRHPRFEGLATGWNR